MNNKQETSIKESQKLKDVELKCGWCFCGPNCIFHSYPQDGECSCGVYKHHVHCARCGHICQVG